MAKNQKNQPEKRTASDLLPRFFRTEANKKFLKSTIDQMIQPGSIKQINGFVGRKTSKAKRPDDVYIGDVSKSRSDYQLEPVVVSKNETGNVSFYRDYNDYINTLEQLGANTRNHSRLNGQEMYAWNPNIDWDKFVNFREYYWLPNGPLSVNVFGNEKDVSTSFSVSVNTSGDSAFYEFSFDKSSENPSLNFYRGHTYTIQVNTPGYPIAISLSRTATPGQDVTQGTSQLYTTDVVTKDENGNDVTGEFIEKGSIEFTITENTPDVLYYISSATINTSGEIRVKDASENTAIDVREILGRKTYTSSNGVTFTNGLKVKFLGDVKPQKYQKGFYYVEGVGSSIELVSEKDLTAPAVYSQQKSVPFDSTSFDTAPFSDTWFFADKKDYIVINRSSPDANTWSRYNRWFHRDVIEISSKLNNQTAAIDESRRAKRPIIEFEPGLKLFDHGCIAKKDVDLFDDFTKSAFSEIEGSTGYIVDGVSLVEGMRVVFNADADSRVKGNIYEVKFIDFSCNDGTTEKQIKLSLATDSDLNDLDSVVIRRGNKYAGKIFHYLDGKWKPSQEKTRHNQTPLFDVFDENGVSFADSTVYQFSTFAGTPLFSYEVGHGTVDPELGFPLSYRSISNTGDILFRFDLLKTEFEYELDEVKIKKDTSIGYLQKTDRLGNVEYVNGFTSDPVHSTQRVVRVYTATLEENKKFEIDVYDDPATVENFNELVYVNGNKTNKYSIEHRGNRVFVVLEKQANTGDTITVKTLAARTKNENGYYEVPFNLERNPLNGDVDSFTLGEVVDHVSTIADECPDFVGEFPGASNIRDLGNASRYGNRFVKHSGPINIPAYHLSNKKYNIATAIDYAQEEYARFKRMFLETAERLGYDGPFSEHVDLILREANAEKTSDDPFHISDMAPSGAYSSLVYTVLDSRTELYPLSREFSLKEPSSRGVLIYSQNKQLIHGRDYDFSVPGFVRIIADIKEGSDFEIREYESTDGSYIPSTPTKLGLYGKFRPELLLDDTALSMTSGSTGPFKVYAEADESCVYANSRGWFYPVFTSLGAAKEYTTSDVNKLTLKGTSALLYVPSDAEIGGSDTDEFDEINLGHSFVRGHDGSYTRAFKDFRDELLIELETRIFNNIKVRENTLFDVNDFLGHDYKANEFSKSEVDQSLQASFSNWLTLVEADFTDNSFYDRNNSFTFNYRGSTSPNGNPLPGFWRGVYRYAYGTDCPHVAPWEILGFTVKPLWWEETYGAPPYTSNNLLLWRDIEKGVIRRPGKDITLNKKYARPGITRHLPVDSMGNLLSPADSGYAKNITPRLFNKNFLFGDVAPVESAWRRSSHFPFAVLKAYLLNKPAHVMGIGFDVSRTKRNAAGQISYDNTQKPIVIEHVKIGDLCTDRNDRIFTSGLVTYMQDLIARDRHKNCQEYRQEFKRIKNQLGFKLGGFTDKNKLRIVLDSRSPFASDQEGIFLPDENYDVVYNVSSPTEVVNYSGIVVERLPSGYVIRGYNNDRPYFSYYSPETSGKQTIMQVGGIAANVRIWEANTRYIEGQIVKHKENFYQVRETFTSGNSFDTKSLRKIPEVPVSGGRKGIIYKNFDKSKVNTLAYGTKLRSFQEVIEFMSGYGEYLRDIGFDFEYTKDGSSIDNFNNSIREFLLWTTQNWAEGTMIALSPAANSLVFKSEYSVVDNIFDNHRGYSLYQANGEPLPREECQLERSDNTFVISSSRSPSGIFGVSLPLVQKEHVVLLDNRSAFNDVMYDLEAGYRRDRVKVIGYKSENWNGGLNIPGFVYDDVVISDWKKWQDYDIGSIVKYKQFYYVANKKIVGSGEFTSSEWIRLTEKPKPSLAANFDFKASQFEDFYDIDTESFDQGIQESARGLVGYTRRSYLASIIKDDVSQFKFYQGFIRDKGTKTALDNLFNALGDAGKESLEFYEDWAIRVGRYGAVDDVQHFDVVITPDDLQEVPQSVELVNRMPVDVFDTTMRVLPGEFYDRSCYCPDRPFKTLNETKEVIKTSGYVNEDDIDFVSTTVEELANGNVNDLRYGGYIWITETDSNPWDVLQHVKTKANATSLTAGGETDNVELFEIKIDRWATGEIQPGDIIGVRGAEQFELTGLYQVRSIKQDVVIIEVPVDNSVQTFNNEKFEITKMRSVRTKDISSVGIALDSNLTKKQRVWVDDVNGNWQVLQGKSPFESVDTLVNPNPNAVEFGKNISVSDDNKTMFVSEKNAVNIYGRNSEKDKWTSLGQLTLASGNEDAEYGYSISACNDGKYLAVGCPGTSEVVVYRRIKNGYLLQETLAGSNRFGEKVQLVSNKNFYTLAVGSASGAYEIYTTGSVVAGSFAGRHRTSSSYAQGNTVLHEGRYYVALADVPRETALSNSFYWEDATWKKTQTIDGAEDNIIPKKGAIEISQDGKVIVVVAEQSNVNVLAVYRYNETSKKYSLDQSIFVPGRLQVEGNWSNSIALHPTGEFVAAGIPTYSGTHLEQGRVYVYRKGEVGYSDSPEVIDVPVAAEIERFGYSIEFGDRELIVASMFGDQYFETTFDDQTTVLDQEFTEIGRTRSNTGAVFVYELFEQSFIFSAKFAYDKVTRDFGKYIAVSKNHVYTGLPRQETNGATGSIADFRRDRDERNWQVIREPVSVVDLDSIAGIYVYNKRTNRLVSYVDYVDPIQGKIPGLADQEISYKMAVDPAKYNTGEQNDSAVNPDLHWGKEHVGELWWNTRRARFVNPYQGNTQYQKDNWNVLSEGSSIEVYEWVESSITPERWDSLADTDKGINRGISGTSVYGNARYTTELVYDKISQTFGRKYYFWVKNKATVPAVAHRSLSAINVANLIESPRLQGYRFVSFLADNKFVLNNFETLVNNNDVVLAIKVHTGENSNQKVHSQYRLLSDGLSTSLPSKEIEQKWFDSLIGVDVNDNPVPDLRLPIRSRYGIQNRPRQSMFVNRVEALKQYIERVNRVLADVLVVDEYNTSGLFEKDPQPRLESGFYDEVVDTEAELDELAPSKFRKAKLEAVIENGRITSVSITDQGKGYRTPPTVTTTSVQGKDFEALTEIDSEGKIKSITVIRPGSGYEQETELKVRGFSVLVRHDSRRAGQWSVNELINNNWNVVKVQKFDVSLYWNYKDWYAPGFDGLAAPDHQVDQFFELLGHRSRVGELVKVKNSGSGGWTLMKKTSNTGSSDITADYTVVGRERGTIEFLSSLYDSDASVIGFDNQSYDRTLIDKTPAMELRIILETVRDHLFVGDLSTEYNQLFVASLRRVLTEQPSVDWLFKTSFVRAVHRVGELAQTINFKPDSLESYEEYVNEVKPYSTNVREYVSAYNKTEHANQATTDFDSPPVFVPAENKVLPDTSVVIDDEIQYSDGSGSSVARDSWKSNNTFYVSQVAVVDGGSGYTNIPKVEFHSDSGSGAQARAYVSGGKVKHIEVTAGGTGYLSAPSVVIVPAQESPVESARAVSVIDNNTVRSIKVVKKFDRVKGIPSLSDKQQLKRTEAFVGTGETVIFDLQYPMMLDTNFVTVFVNEQEQFKSKYSFANKENNDSTYTRKQGRITFVEPPQQGDKIKVVYMRSISTLDAADRITAEYAPDDDMFGKDLSQLMKGVDFGGVEITGTGFGSVQGWDTQGWYTGEWDSYEEVDEDIVFVASGENASIQLDEPLEDGIEYTVYVGNSDRRLHAQDIRIDDQNFDSGYPTNPNATMQTIIGDGSTTTLFVENFGVELGGDQVFILRKLDSDGSTPMQPGSYDTQLSGGNLAYTSASGVLPEEVVTDGSKFVSPVHNGKTEELVPGTASDTLDIQIWQKPDLNQGVIVSQVHKGNGQETVFAFENAPGNENSVIVKVAGKIVEQSQYSIDWNNLSISLNSAPNVGEEVNIVSLSTYATNVVDIGRIALTSKEIKEIIIDVKYQEDYAVLANVNGEPVQASLKKYGARSKIVFDTKVPAGKAIDYTVFADDSAIVYSNVVKNSFSANTDNIYPITEVSEPGAPLRSNVVVIVDKERMLNSGYRISLVVTKAADFVVEVEEHQFSIGSLDAGDIDVYLNKTKLDSSDWVFEKANNRVNINKELYRVGDLVEVYVSSSSDYYFDENNLIIKSSAGSFDSVDVYQFVDFGIPEIDRYGYRINNTAEIDKQNVGYSSFKDLQTGLIRLDTPAVDSGYIWVAKNNKILTANVDYTVKESGRVLELASKPSHDDVVDVVHFIAPASRPQSSMRIFKDMLNRTHYKALGFPETVLAQPLQLTDDVIRVADASSLYEPIPEKNIPGVVFILGERIEYFKKQGNDLMQLRRATLGTGAKDTYAMGTQVVDQSIVKNLEYKDSFVEYRTTIDNQSNHIDLDFSVGSENEVEIFLGGYRLRKNQLHVFDPDIAMDSPQGDVIVPPEFTVTNNGVNSTVVINTDVIRSELKTSNGELIDGITFLAVKKVGRKLFSAFGSNLIS